VKALLLAFLTVNGSITNTSRPLTSRLPDTRVGDSPEGEMSEPNGQPTGPVDALQLVTVEPLVNVEFPKLERNDELPTIMDPINPASTALELMVLVELPANTDKPDPIQAPVEPKGPDEPPAADEPIPIPVRVEPSGKDEQNDDNQTISISPPPEPAITVHVEPAVVISVEKHSQQPRPSFGHWCSTLFEIKQKIEHLASDTLQRFPRLDEVSVSRSALVAHA
jgi:hypothetical protein